MRGLTVLIAGCLADFTFGALNKRLNIAVVTDVHIGESCNGDLSLGGCKPVKALTDVVDHINKLHTIDGVFATGDLTSSALTEEFQKFREIMNGLTVPWWPLLGNHDSWSYSRHADGSFNQTETPIGDAIFAEVFGDILSERVAYKAARTKGWPSGPSLNKDFNYDSWFHNFIVEFPDFSPKFKFLNLDWVARENALPEPGVGPQAELHNFPGGTLDWLSRTLKEQDPDSKFFIMQHHPFHNRLAFSPVGHNYIKNFTFDDTQSKEVQKVLAESFTSKAFIGVHAGHMHRWFNGTAFTKFTCLDESWLTIPEWETPASKGWFISEDYIGSIQIFAFEATPEGDVTLESVRGLWEVPPDQDYRPKPSVRFEEF